MCVLVYTENWEGRFRKLSFELVSYAAGVAKMMNSSVTVVSIGDVAVDELKKLGNYGATKIININGGQYAAADSQVFTRILSEVAKKEEATVILFTGNNSGRALAPRLSVRLKAGIATGVSRLPFRLEPFTVYKKSFSGNAFAHLEINSPIRILTLAQNSFDPVETKNNAVVENLNIGTEISPAAIVVKKGERQTGKILLSEADIVISGGRGMRSPDQWPPLLELAELLGAATACTRPVSDEGWRPHEEHAGQTGKIIAPNLYIAIGISGATQHLAGVSTSKCIVAINTDRNAPIFDAAQYGIVGDAFKVLPKLVSAVKELRR